jgi:hypothetical protein
MKQGAWTDLYALGSVVHYAVMGHTPPESVARLIHDTMLPLQRAAAGRYSERFLRAIDHALGVRPQDRPQSVAELRAELGIQPRVPRLRKPGDIPTAPQPLESRPASLDDDATRPPEGPTIVPLQAAPQAMPRPAVAAPARAPRRAAGVWLGAALLTPALALVAWWALRPVAPPVAAGLPPPAARPGKTDVAPDAVPSAAPNTAPDTAPGGETAPRRNQSSVTELPKALPQPTEAVDAVEPAAPASPTAPAASAAADAPPAARAEAAKPPRPSAPKLNSQNARCTEIIARVSLGEPLSAAERAILQRECR